MRALFVIALALISANARAEVVQADMVHLPNPPGCADYRNNATGAADDACNAAIAQESDPAAKSMLLFRRAYIEVGPGDFARYDAALADLGQAIALYPDNWAAHHERAYIYVEYGRWNDALADLNIQAALDPRDPTAYRERALARFKLGDLQGAYDDRTAQIGYGETDFGAYLARARMAMWLGKFDAAKSDIALAEGAAGNADAAAAIAGLRRELSLWTTTAGSGAAQRCATADMHDPASDKTLIGDCTQAFMAATTAKARSDALTARSEGWLMLQQDQDRWTEDLQMAAALDPGNAGALSNLAFAYVHQRHSTAALPLFDRSIAIEPTFFNYAGRANARFNLGDLAGAEADAEKSNALQANEVALTVLGDIAYARTKTYDKAKAFWIEAYRLGDRDDGLTARLKDAGVAIPPPPAGGSTP